MINDTLVRRLHSDRILVIGAGISGATVARVLAEAGFEIAVMERLDHPGGHCYSYRDADTGIMLHAHGPHILHSDNTEVWAFAQRFAVLRPYYPLRLVGEEPLAARYFAAARTVSGVSFVGRLATYRYIDMDVAIAEALAGGHRLVASLKAGETPLTFFVAGGGSHY